MGFNLQMFMEELETIRRAGLSNQEAAEAYDEVVKSGYDYAVECGNITEINTGDK